MDTAQAECFCTGAADRTNTALRACNVALCSRQLVQQLIFKLLELDRKFSVLNNELRLGLLEVRTLFIYNKSKQLVFQSLRTARMSGCSGRS